MKIYKVIASYVTQCTIEIPAENEEAAYLAARELDGAAFQSEINPDDWQIEHITEVKSKTPFYMIFGPKGELITHVNSEDQAKFEVLFYKQQTGNNATFERVNND